MSFFLTKLQRKQHLSFLLIRYKVLNCEKKTPKADSSVLILKTQKQKK